MKKGKAENFLADTLSHVVTAYTFVGRALISDTNVAIAQSAPQSLRSSFGSKTY